MIKSKLLGLSIVGALVLSMSACQYRDNGTNNGVRPNNVKPFSVNRANQAHDGNLNIRTNDFVTRGNNHGNMTAGHQNTKMKTSQQIADRIAAIRGVRSANVLLTDYNAYVAVTLDRTERNQTLPGNNAATMPKRMTKHKNMNTGVTNRAGMTRNGVTSNGINGNSVMPQNTTSTGTFDSDVTKMLKNQIADTVKSTAPSVANVYVSANPDFVASVNGYVNQLAAGHPFSGFITEFNAMVERIFPSNAGSLQ